MIDNPEQVERLVAKLRESLPLFATVTPEVAVVIREQSGKLIRRAGIQSPEWTTPATREE